MKNQLIKVLTKEGNGLEWQIHASLLNSHIILIDFKKMDTDGLAALKIISDTHPNKNIIILSLENDADFTFDAKELKRSTLALQETDNEQPTSFIKENYEEVSSFTKKILCNSINSCACLTTSSRTPNSGNQKIDALTKREKEILYEVKNGLTNKEIAKLLGITENTVKNHLRNIMAKLKMDNRVQAATYAIEAL